MKFIIVRLERVSNLKGEAQWTMALTRVGIISCCALLVTFFGIGRFPIYAQNSRGSLDVRQAITEQQILSNASELAHLREEVGTQQSMVGQLRDEIALQKGVGIGIASVIGMLQALQVILQVKAVRPNGGNNSRGHK